ANPHSSVRSSQELPRKSHRKVAAHRVAEHMDFGISLDQLEHEWCDSLPAFAQCFAVAVPLVDDGFVREARTRDPCRSCVWFARLRIQRTKAVKEHADAWLQA